MFTPAELFDLSQTEHAAVFDAEAPAWETLPRLAKYLAPNCNRPITPPYRRKQ